MPDLPERRIGFRSISGIRSSGRPHDRVAAIASHQGPEFDRRSSGFRKKQQLEYWRWRHEQR
jgi:hypothetical protein